MPFKRVFKKPEGTGTGRTIPRVIGDGNCLLRCVWAALLSFGFDGRGKFDREVLITLVLEFFRLNDNLFKRLKEPVGVKTLSELIDILNTPYCLDDYQQFAIYQCFLLTAYHCQLLDSRQSVPRDGRYIMVENRDGQTHFNLAQTNEWLTDEAIEWLNEENERYEAKQQAQTAEMVGIGLKDGMSDEELSTLLAQLSP